MGHLRWQIVKPVSGRAGQVQLHRDCFPPDERIEPTQLIEHPGKYVHHGSVVFLTCSDRDRARGSC
jgi:hypothetical protein